MVITFQTEGDTVNVKSETDLQFAGLMVGYMLDQGANND
jgi:hypothetical protein